MNSVQKSSSWMNPVQVKTFAPGGNNLPVRDAIFSLERLEQHAQELAGTQTLLSDPRRGRGLSRRVRDNARVLTESYRSIVAAIRAERSITPAAEWLVDNFFVVDEQLREIVKDLPSGFYKKLPKLQNGALERYPRIFGLAWEFIAHTDSHFDLDALTRFINAYQQSQPSRLVNCGRCRSRCGLCSWKTCAAFLNGSWRHGLGAKRRMLSPTSCWG
jgi:hypothetical protein